MARIRPEYERSWWPRFKRWVLEGSGALDERMREDVTADASAYAVPQAAGDRTEELREQALQNEQETYDHLRVWSATSGRKWLARLYRLLAIIICLGVIAVLLVTASYLPPYGSPDNPVHNEVSQRYIEKGMEETGAVNIVAGMILDYRAFDTLGESNVLFVAACSVLILMRITSERDEATAQLEMEAEDRGFEPKNDRILQAAASFLVPLILMFGAYVILNGHISPGGGFSGGAVMGAGLILYLNAFGFKKTERFFRFRTFQVVSLCALTFYAVSKTYSFFTGANHLASFITPGTPGRIFSAGLIPYLNIAVGLVVCCTMYAFYTLFRKGDM